jgi:hypothetical protein
MMSKNAKGCVLLILGILFLINPVFAAITTIRPGETVFLGEQGLDITLAMEGDTQIGWWASAAVIATTSPDGSVSVSNPASFSVSPNLFGTKTGVWYHLKPSGQANGTAFNVADPQLDIKVWDTTVNVDVTDTWVSTDDELQFRINSNLVPITQRSGVTSVPITIKVQSPSGAVFSSLISKSGATKDIVDYPVTTTPENTGSIWGTSNRATYPPGTYTIWAECNVNSMKDYYDVAGKTVSRKVSLLNQDQNPLIRNKEYVTNPTTQITLAPTTKIITTALTTASTTLQTPPPTSAVPTVLPVTTAAMTEIPTTPLPTPTPTPTKSPGFGASIVVVAMIFGLVLFFKKQ